MLNYALILLPFVLVEGHGNQPCLGAPTTEHSFVASPESCDAYIICMNGQTIRGERCPTGRLFEPRAQICGSSTCMDCSPFGIQNLPYPMRCNEYIECNMGHRIFRICPNGFLFDRTIGGCNSPHLVTCPDDPSMTTTTTTEVPVEPSCSNGERYHPHPYDCTRFFICVDSVLWPQECPNGWHWSRQSNICTHPELAGCSREADTTN